MNLIKSLEQLGQVSSLKQYQSVHQMISVNNQDEDLLIQAIKQSEELICFVEPEDED